MNGSLLLRNGALVTSSAVFLGDVFVRDGVIEGIGDGPSWQAEVTIDVGGRMVLPGGIDVHTHFNYPVAGFTAVTVDDFASGTAAAAFGGTTCVVDFAKTRPGGDLYATYKERLVDAGRGAVVDFAVHAIVPPWSSDREFDALARLVDEGATSWKFFMCYPGLATSDEVIFAGFRRCAELGVLPLVHAESDTMLRDALERLRDEGRLEPSAHLAAHPADAEDEGTRRAIELAAQADVPLYIVHVTSAGAAAEIGAARQRGQHVFGETCPQYLARSFEDYGTAGERTAASYICSPPIRERRHQEALWEALSLGVLSTVASDHACFCLDPDPSSTRPHKHHDRFLDVPNGVPGVEERMMVTWQAGVETGRIDPRRFVEVTATAPAKLLGLYPKKGAIEVGSDADLVVWGEHADICLRAGELHSRARYSLYDGMQVSARPDIVISRGEVIIEDGVLKAKPGRGEHVLRPRRARSWCEQDMTGTVASESK